MKVESDRAPNHRSKAPISSRRYNRQTLGDHRKDFYVVTGLPGVEMLYTWRNRQTLKNMIGGF
jgi:hypothetical protein